MVKANAYGHGDIVIAKTLEELGVENLGVCLIEEGIRLRKNDIHADILVFRGFDQSGAFALYEHRLAGVVSQWNQLEYLVKVGKKFQEKVPFHLKFDTGMNRLGFSVNEAPQIEEFLRDHPELEIKSVLTHLHSGEDAHLEQGHSAEQLRRLLSVTPIFDPLRIPFHALNSAGLAHLFMLNKQNHRLNNVSGRTVKSSPHILQTLNWGLRPGLALYGYCDSLPSDENLLQPIMSLKSRISVLRKLQPGETVSYGATWKAHRTTDLAVVPLGYADGYHRATSNQAEALFMGIKVPVVGNVCMDYMMLDITDALAQKGMSSTSEGLYEEEVLLFGPEHGANLIAQKSHSITWEVLTSVSERVPRVYMGQMSRFITNEVFN